MAKENIWQEIDGSVASLVGQRVFYNHNGVKCLAFVVKAGYERNAEGQILNRLAVFAQDGDTFIVDAALSSDRRVGSFDIAQPGDLTDSGKAPEGTFTPSDFAAQQPQETKAQPAPGTNPNATPQPSQDQTFDPADTNQDGTVSPKERKRFDKENA
jgi:hypothetical protein